MYSCHSCVLLPASPPATIIISWLVWLVTSSPALESSCPRDHLNQSPGTCLVEWVCDGWPQAWLSDREESCSWEDRRALLVLLPVCPLLWFCPTWTWSLRMLWAEQVLITVCLPWWCDDAHSQDALTRSSSPPSDCQSCVPESVSSPATCQCLIVIPPLLYSLQCYK